MINRKWIGIGGSLTCIALLGGCSGGDQATSRTTTAANQASESSSPSTEQTPPANTAGSPASDASQCVAIFLDSLRRGDERSANSVLTAKARDELSKTAYVIQPLGTPEGEYTIGRVGFPYEEKSVALVECTWTEPPLPGEEQLAMEIVCEVQQELDGWRISCLGVSIPGTDEAIVLDFEDAASLQATIEAATAPSPSDYPPPSSESQQVVQQTQQGSFEGLPAYPTQQPISEESSAPPQLAYPNQYDAPVKR